MLPKLITRVPGPRSKALARKLQQYECRNITYIDSGFPIFWESARGSNVWDVEGNRFLDFTCAFGVTTLGHSNPQTVFALHRQTRKLLHAMGDVHPSSLKPLLCEKLSKITFERWTKDDQRKLCGKTILCNSGFEAVEAALKTAYLKTKKRGVLAFSGSYHGLGYGAVDVTGWKEFRDPFKKQIARFTTFAPYPTSSRRGSECTISHQAISAKKYMQPNPKMSENNLHTLLRSKLCLGKIGAILVEPVQGRGGEIIPPVWFLPLLRRLANEFSIPLIFDEIYTGFHRTGPFFACEDVGDGSAVIPDMICLGKALTGGFPMSACVGESRLMDEAWPESTGEAIHTSTFLGNPLGCAMALESIRLHSNQSIKGFTPLIKELEEQLFALRKHPLINDIRGRGLMWGIEMGKSHKKNESQIAGIIIQRLLQSGIILLNGGVKHNVLSLSIPLCIQAREIKFFTFTLKKIISDILRDE